MFKTYDEAVQTVMARQNQTYGIDGLKQALSALGAPQNKLNTIHIGGTNGKGSTTNYTRSILQEAGMRVGSFTSPHLVRHNDRIRINNIEISDEDFLSLCNETYPLWDEYILSMFEIDMIISLLYFIREKVDVVVYEVGLGGRLDATNVITPCATGITNVGLDHQAILGDTVEKIAAEKAGIIKHNVPAFTASTDASVIDVLQQFASRVETTLTVLSLPQYTIENRGYRFIHEGMTFHIKNQGVYQVANASLAVSLVKAVFPELEEEAYINAVANASWAGRFEELRPNVFIDGAHNDMGIGKLIDSMVVLPKPWTVVFTALRDKDFVHMLDALEANFDHVIVTEFSFKRAATADELAENHNVEIVRDYRQAIERGQALQGDGTLVITGSLYFISEVREYFNNKEKV